MTLFILFVSIIALLFLFINLVFAPHNPYQEKDSMFECGFHSFQQSRSPFNIAFFIYALVYLLLDLEILLTFPFAVSEYVNNIYGLIITLGFITIITIGFVYELGKGALKIPSKQYTYTIKNQPLIHISYIKTKSAEVTKPHPFITSPPLQSSIFPFTKSIKNIKKYFTFKNLIIGLIGLIVMALVKTLHIPMYILNFLNLENVEILELELESIIAGIFGLVSRLGARGIVEDIFDKNNFTARGGEDPTQGNAALDRDIEDISNVNVGGSLSGVEEGGQSPWTRIRGEHYRKLFDDSANDLSEEVKKLTELMENASSDEEWKKLNERRNSTILSIKEVTKISLKGLDKTAEPSDIDSNVTKKRDFDDLDKENKEEGEPSKKK